jgi:diaminopimelate decarboxylase
MGIEVASGMELELALACGANQILFNGPAKTIPELSLALTHPDRVTVIMDSLNELRRLVALANQTGVRIRTGVRLSFENHGHWRKFGIAPADLAIFIEQARSSEHIDLKGLHFHTSWNMDPGVQVQTLVQLGKILSKLRPDMLGELAFIDIGGGFWPPQGQWLPASGSEDNPGFFTTVAAAPLNEYADRIAGALREHVFTHLSVAVYAEPGRWIVNDAVQILLKILDIKEGGLVITDGGTNLVGWERFEHEYFPLINLTRPGLTERPSLILGSLCTPDDLWGRSYFGQEIGLEDVFLIPMQGAYTYSLRQRFIKPLPATVFLPAGSEAELVEEANP